VNIPLCRPDQERGACGIGFVADTSGKPSFGAPERAAARPDLIRGPLHGEPLAFPAREQERERRTVGGSLITGSEGT
jgi:hypothetical protein